MSVWSWRLALLRGIVGVLGLLGLTLLLAAPSRAVTYQVDFSGGAMTTIGTFSAPAGGGLVTNFMLTLSGVLFDTPTATSGTPSYDPTINEFTYVGPGFVSYTNSIATALCGVGQCFLEIYPDPTPGVPGDYLAVDANLNNIDVGMKYIINPTPISAIPIPAPVLLLLAGIAALMVVARHRTTARHKQRKPQPSAIKT